MNKSYFYSALMVAAIALISIPSCSKKAEDACSTNQVASAECTKAGDAVFVNLPIAYEDSFFMDAFAGEWKSLQASQLEGGTLTTTLPIYSTFLGTTKADALNRVSQAKAQFEQGTVGSVNDIPYVQLKAEPDYRYVFRYQKQRLDGTVVYQTSGQVPFVNNKHLLPIVNETFNNNLYTASDRANVEYNHVLSFSAQKGSVVSNNIKEIKFRTVYVIPNVDFKTLASAEISGLNLANRWNYIYTSAALLPTQSLKFAKLEAQERGGEASPLDVKITFKETPKAELVQVLFYEVPFNLGIYRDTKINTGFPEIVPVRGYEFHERTITLDTKTAIDGTPDPALGLKIYLAGTEVFQAKNGSGLYIYRETNEGTSMKLPAVAPHTPFDIEFAFDFSVSPAVLSPLKPDCLNEKGLPFNPISSAASKDAQTNQGNFLAICHPDTLQEETIPAGSNSIARKDTWFSYFNFAPYMADTTKGPSVYRLGFLNGIREIEIKISGCVRVQMKPGSSNTWETKTTGTGGCGTGYEDYSAFVFTKRMSIFDDNLAEADGLRALVNAYRAKPTINAPELYMNKKKVETTSKFLF